ncbi:ankyrin repeat-containing domain protein [Globomyces pollinis-pini]|nr:ankyrin repeat-containing domain protein [Globomyces pollinis-pini]
MNNSTGNRESTSKNLEGFPVEIKQMIAKYLPIRSLVNLKMCSKGLNYNYGFSEEQLLEFYHNKRLFDSATAFKCYLQFNDPTKADFEFAIKNNKGDVVRVFLDDERFHPTENEIYAVRIASKFGHTEILRMLLNDDRVDPSENNSRSLRYASNSGLTEIVKMLLRDERVDPSALNNYAIGRASSKGYTEIVKILLDDNRVDPSADDNYAIKYASKNGRTEIVELLLQDERVDPSADDNFAIRLASEKDPSADDNYPIWTASVLGHTEIVKMLLDDQRLRVNDSMIKLLIELSEYGHVEKVELQLGNGRVDPTVDDNFVIRISASKHGIHEMIKWKTPLNTLPYLDIIT